MFERIIADHARFRSDAPAFIDGRSRATYGRMADDIARCAGWLRNRGCGPGERVVLHVPSVYRHWLLFFAVEALGSTSIAVDAGKPLNRSRLRFLKADRLITIAAPDGDPGLPVDVVDGSWLIRLRRFRVLPMPKRSRSGDDPICIVLSSGTTAQPKKVLLTRAMIDLRAIEERSSDLIHDGARVLQALPNHSIGGLVTTVSTWAVGATLGVQTPETPMPDLLARLRPTVIVGAPSHLARIVDALPEDFASDPPIHVSAGGGALADGVAATIARKLRGRIAMTYASTEMGYVARGDHAALQAHEDAAGTVLPYAEVQVRDDEGHRVADGAEGRVWVRGRHVVDGFLDDPEQTDASFSDGWFHPGDLGSLRADGLLFVTGRSDDLMNFRGLKMLAPRIETRLMALAVVDDAAVFMAPRPGDPEPVPWIVYRADRSVAPRDLAPAMPPGVPFHLVRIETMPRNAMGKIDRGSLRALAGAR